MAGSNGSIRRRSRSSRSTPRLPGGAYWPGGIAAHANGDLHMVFGRWAHRLSTDLDVLASHRLPVPKPHNSFVVLDGGELVTKDCDAPAGLEPSTVSVLDPETLLPVAPPLRLPEPSIARLAGDGETRDRGRHDDGLPAPARSRGGAARDRRSLAPELRPRSRPQLRVGSRDHRRACPLDGQRPQPGRPVDGRQRRSNPIRSGSGGPAVTTAASARPRSAACRSGPNRTRPAGIPDARIVVAYDAGNAVVRAWRMNGDELEPLWRRDGLAHAGHLILYPDTRELIVGDWRDVEALRRPLIRPRRSSRRSAALAIRRRPGEPRCDSAATSSWCSTSTRARRRHASTSPPPRRDSSSPPPASAVTSTTNR